MLEIVKDKSLKDWERIEALQQLSKSSSVELEEFLFETLESEEGWLKIEALDILRYYPITSEELRLKIGNYLREYLCNCKNDEIALYSLQAFGGFAGKQDFNLIWKFVTPGNLSPFKIKGLESLYSAILTNGDCKELDDFYKENAEILQQFGLEWAKRGPGGLFARWLRLITFRFGPESEALIPVLDKYPKFTTIIWYCLNSGRQHSQKESFKKLRKITG